MGYHSLALKTPTTIFSCRLWDPNPKHKTPVLSSPCTSLNTSSSASFSYKVEFKTLECCKLGIARYPDFEYNAEGGVGTGVGKVASGKQGEGEGEGEDDVEGELILVDFDVDALYIPPLSSATTKLLGLPLPPLLKIDIVPELFRGTINKLSGEVDLEFKANFWFSVGTLYRAPPLLVEATLTSEESTGKMRSGRGRRLDNAGRCRLVGVARVEPIEDLFMNTFLGLPTECLADLNATMTLAQSA